MPGVGLYNSEMRFDALETPESYVLRNRERLTERLRKFCSQESVAATGVGLSECAALLQNMMDEIGIPNKRFENEGGNSVIYGEVRASKSDRTLVFYNHYDVQPPEPVEEWVTPPFSPDVRDNCMFARGVSDNKGPLVGRLNIIESYLKTQGEPPVNVKFLIEGEEEVGSPHLRPFVARNRELLKGDAMLWESGSMNSEGRPIVNLGVKGILYVELRAKGARTDVHSSEAILVPNPAWRLIWALGTMKGPDERVLIDGFYDEVRPLSKEEIEVVDSEPFEEDTRRKNYGLERFLLGLTGNELKHKWFGEPSVTVCGFESGYTGKGPKTVIPNSAAAKLDFRLVPDQRPDDILQKLRRHLADRGFGDIEVIPHTKTDPCRTSLSNRYVQAEIKILEKLRRKKPLVTVINPGSGPQRVFSEELGIPILSGGGAYFNPSQRAHSPNEFVNLDSWIKATADEAEFVREFGEVEL